MNKTVEIAVIFKTRNKDGNHEDLTLQDMELKNAYKAYKKLIRRWKKHKVVKIPGHMIAIASDEIYTITVRG